MRQFWDAALTQDVWPPFLGWRLLNARCFACSFGMTPSAFAIRILQISISAGNASHGTVVCNDCSPGALALCTLTRRWGSNIWALELQFCDPQIQGPPQYVSHSIVVLAGGRRRCKGLGGVGFAPSNEDLAFRAGVCHLMNLFVRTMFKLRQGPVQLLALYGGH